MKHDGGIFERIAFDAPSKSFYTEQVMMRALLCQALPRSSSEEDAGQGLQGEE
jgi:hypothetical protein